MCFKVKKKIGVLRCEEYISIDRPHEWKGFIADLQKAMFENEVAEWSNRIQSCENGRKLRTYKLFKHSFSTEKYITCIMANNREIYHM